MGGGVARWYDWMVKLARGERSFEVVTAVISSRTDRSARG